MDDTSVEAIDNVVIDIDNATDANVNDNTQIESPLLHMLSDVAVAAIVTTSPSSTANVRLISTPERIENRTTPPDCTQRRRIDWYPSETVSYNYRSLYHKPKKNGSPLSSF